MENVSNDFIVVFQCDLMELSFVHLYQYGDLISVAVVHYRAYYIDCLKRLRINTGPFSLVFIDSDISVVIAIQKLLQFPGFPGPQIYGKAHTCLLFYYSRN